MLLRSVHYLWLERKKMGGGWENGGWGGGGVGGRRGEGGGVL